MRIENIQPILAVKSFSESRKFYIDILEFNEDSWGNDTFTSIRRENTGIYLCEGRVTGKPRATVCLKFLAHGRADEFG
jgi:hypothetical protein